jgi:4-nitrophenyl phosphatase
VLWRGDEPLPGLVPFFEMLRSKNLLFALATNNSSKSPADYIGKLERMGVAGITIRQIITSGTVTMSYLQENFPPGSPLHVLGGDGLRRVITEAGFALGDEGVSAVVVGLDPQLTYEKLRRAALLIRAGAAFIATNADATIPSPDGLAPGAGSIVAALRTATDCEPLVIGKPGRPMFEAAVRLLGTSAEQTLMIGDRLATDILGAAQAGLRTALVLTGVSTRAEAAASPVQPDGIYNDLPALLTAWG